MMVSIFKWDLGVNLSIKIMLFVLMGQSNMYAGSKPEAQNIFVIM